MLSEALEWPCVLLIGGFYWFLDWRGNRGLTAAHRDNVAFFLCYAGIVETVWKSALVFELVSAEKTQHKK